MVIILFTLSGCNTFSFEKLSSEEILEEELNAISWNNVDVYPTFDTCKELSEEKELKHCFEQKVTQHLYEQLLLKKDSLRFAKSDTLSLYIAETGSIQLGTLQVSHATNPELNLMEKWCNEALQSLPQIYPAQKRGIPVSTIFVVPIILKQE